MLTKRSVWTVRTLCAAVVLGIALLATATVGIVFAQDMMKAPAGASVKITSPKNGEAIKNPVRFTFAVTGMTVAPAGTLKEGTGHHHLIIDGGPLPEGTVVPADDRHIHLGKGQTELEMRMPPGKHTFTAQFADGLHRSYGPVLSDSVTITVEIY